MKILKSGIEMNHEELKAIKGGACACSCLPGFNSGSLNISGDEDDDCYCGCSPGDLFIDAVRSAFRRI